MGEVITRKHYARLRQYWQAGHGGLVSIGDGVALTLPAEGLLERVESPHGLTLRITGLGIKELQAESYREKERRRPHHDMADRLAAWLQDADRQVWTNIEFRVGSGLLVRPDVFSIEKVLSPGALRSAIHEVKVSRSDFLADLAKPEKRNGYAAISEALYYVAPQRMIASHELPPGAGLVEEVDVGTFKLMKRAKRRKVQLQPEHLLNLILKPKAIQHEYER